MKQNSARFTLSLALSFALTGVMQASGADLPKAHVPRVPLGGDYWKATDVAPGEVWGIADLHAHFFTYLAYGGRVFHGKSFSSGGMSDALHGCGEDHGDDGHGHSTAILPEEGHLTSGYPGFEGWPKYNSLVHQQAYVDWIRRAWQGGVRLVQMDVQNTPFLGKAYAAGNFLTVHGDRTPLPLDDISALKMQVAAAHEMFVNGPASDFAAIAMTPDEARQIITSGKMAIVLGIEVEALGNLVRPEQLGPNPRAGIRDLLKGLWNSGVRHVIPIHLSRNAFGHPAFFNRLLNDSNYSETGSFYSVGEAFDDGIRFDPRFVKVDPISFLLETWGSLHGMRAFPPVLAAASALGLTPVGDILIDEMMRKGFIIDIDHMSQRAADRTLELAAAENVPVIASHTNFRDLSFGTQVSYESDGSYRAVPQKLPMSQAKHGEYGTSDAGKVRTERSRTREQLEMIRRLGGMVGVQFISSGVGVSWRDQIPLDCDSSSKGFLQMLLYANEMMGADGSVTFGSDVSGFAEMPAPRFGTDACPGARGDELRRAGGRIRAQALAQSSGVRYSTPVRSIGAWRFPLHGKGDDVAYTKREAKLWEEIARDQTSNRSKLIVDRWSAMKNGPNEPLERSRAGTREFDVNLDGVAHYGLIPDFLQDVTNVLREHHRANELKPMFRSAEFYLKMWEKIDLRARNLAHSTDS